MELFAQTGDLCQKLQHRLRSSNQFCFVGNRPRNLHRKPEVVRDCLSPSSPGVVLVRPIERRIDLAAIKNPAVTLEMTSFGIEAKKVAIFGMLHPAHPIRTGCGSEPRLSLISCNEGSSERAGDTIEYAVAFND